MVKVVLIQVVVVLLLDKVVVVEVNNLREVVFIVTLFWVEWRLRLQILLSHFILICHRPAMVLFYPGSTYSYVSTYFSSSQDILCESHYLQYMFLLMSGIL